MSPFIRCVLQGFGMALGIFVASAALIGLGWCVYLLFEQVWDLSEDSATGATFVTMLFLLLGALFTLHCVGVIGK